MGRSGSEDTPYQNYANPMIIIATILVVTLNLDLFMGVERRRHNWNPPSHHHLRWEFIKENKNVRKQENTLSAKKTIKIKRKNRKKHALDHESDQEKMITVK